MSKLKKHLNSSIAITILTILTITSFGATDLKATTVITDSELATDTVVTPISSDTVQFTLRARWGFVRGNPDNDRTEKNYDGSVSNISTSVEDSPRAKIRLIKTLLFEKHDSLISQANPVSWKSKIYGHWDGVLVNVRAKADANITVNTTKGSITKTAKEWFQLSQPAIAEFGNNEMLVINTYPYKHRRHAVIVWWGKKRNLMEPTGDVDVASSSAPKVNFSGSLTMDTDAYVKLRKALRFEKNDSIDEYDRSHITWTSYITTGRDGLFTLMIPDRNANLDSGLTITLDNIDNGWSQHYSFENIKEGARETITIDGIDYILAIGHKVIPKMLIRAKKSGKFYLIEDNIRKEITDSDVLEANGYTEDEAVEMDDDELESYSEGDELDYPDGTVVEDKNNSYIVSNGVKRLLKTKSIKTKLLSARQQIKTLVTSRIQKIKAGADVSSEEELPDNSLVKIDGSNVIWRIRGNYRDAFPSAKVFNLHRLKWDKIKIISQEKFDSYQWRSSVEYPDGSLIKIPEAAKVYLVRNGKRHWIETEEDFRGLGYQFSDVVDVSISELGDIQEDDPVVADETSDIIQF